MAFGVQIAGYMFSMVFVAAGYDASKAMATLQAINDAEIGRQAE